MSTVTELEFGLENVYGDVVDRTTDLAEVLVSYGAAKKAVKIVARVKQSTTYEGDTETTIVSKVRDWSPVPFTTSKLAKGTK